MNLLFIEGGSRVIRDTEGNIYLGSNLHRSILERYRRYCDSLTLLLRREEKIYEPSEAAASAHKLDEEFVYLADVPDLYKPRSNFFSLSVRNEITSIIKKEILKADKVIIRISGNMYAFTAINMCRKYGRPYMIESVEFIFEMKWYHSLLGKIFAPLAELKGRRAAAHAPYVLYVTHKELQERYPSSGRTLGCSDVSLPVIDSSALQKYVRGGGGISTK